MFLKLWGSCLVIDQVGHASQASLIKQDSPSSTGHDAYTYPDSEERSMIASYGRQYLVQKGKVLKHYKRANGFKGKLIAEKVGVW